MRLCLRASVVADSTINLKLVKLTAFSTALSVLAAPGNCTLRLLILPVFPLECVLVSMCACVHFSSRTSLFTDRHGLATSPALTLSFILASVSLPRGFCTAELLSPRVFLTLYLFVYFSVMAHDWGFKKRRVTAFRVHDWLLRQHSLTTPNLQQNTVPGVLSSGSKKKEEKKKKKEKKKRLN